MLIRVSGSLIIDKDEILCVKLINGTHAQVLFKTDTSIKIIERDEYIALHKRLGFTTEDIPEFE